MNEKKIEELTWKNGVMDEEIAALEAKIAEIKAEQSINRGLILAARMEDEKEARAKAVAKAKLTTVLDYFGTPLAEVKLVVVHEGRKVEYQGRGYSAKKQITIGKVWDVLLDDEVIGQIEYRMFTRENRTPGRMYVNSRWESPGWGYSTGSGFGRQFEASSKKDALERIVKARSRQA